MNSFQILVDNELVTIIFKSLNVGLKIAKQLQSAKDLNINTDQVKKFPENDTSATEIQGVKSENSSATQKTPLDEQLEQMRYARTITSYALQQPSLVDVHLNKYDHRIFIPSSMTCRTILATQDQRQIKEMLQLQPNQIQHILQTQLTANSSIPGFIGQSQIGQPLITSKPPINAPSILPTIPAISPMTGNGFVPNFQQKQLSLGPQGAFINSTTGTLNIPPLDVVKQKIQEFHQKIQKQYEYMLVHLFSSKPSRLVEYASMMNMPQETINSRDQVMQIVQKISEQLIQTQTVDTLMTQIKDNDNLDSKTKQQLLDLMVQLKVYMNYYQMYQEQGNRETKPIIDGQKQVIDVVQRPPNVPVTIGIPASTKPLPVVSGFADGKKPLNNASYMNQVPIPQIPRMHQQQRTHADGPGWSRAPSETPPEQINVQRPGAQASIIQTMREYAVSKDSQTSQHLTVNILQQIPPSQVSRLLNPHGTIATVGQFGTAKRSVNDFADEIKMQQPESQESSQEEAKDQKESPEQFRTLLDKYLQTDLSSSDVWKEARSELAAKLLQVESFFSNHQRFISQQPLYKFHNDFTPYENLALLTLALPPDVKCFDRIKQNAITVVQCDIFAKLNKLVRDKAAPVTQGDVIGAGQAQISAGLTGVTPNVAGPAPPLPGPNLPPVPQKEQFSAQISVGGMSGQQIKTEAPQSKLIKEMEMCNSFKEQVIDLGKKILPYVKANVMVPCIVMILGVGDELNLDVGEGMRFFKSNINRVFHDSAAAFHENMEKVFILAITIIEAVFTVMSSRQTPGKPRPLMYKAQIPIPGGDGAAFKPEHEDAPQFSDFLTKYLKIIEAIKEGRRPDENDLANYYFLNETDVHAILGGHNYADIDAVVDALAIDSTTIPQVIVEKKVSTGFGVDRSETDSDDM